MIFQEDFPEGIFINNLTTKNHKSQLLLIVIVILKMKRNKSIWSRFISKRQDNAPIITIQCDINMQFLHFFL